MESLGDTDVEFSACRTAHTHNTAQQQIEHRTETERETDKEDRGSETGQGRDGTGRDRTRQECRQMATLRESWLPITHACYDFLTTLHHFDNQSTVREIALSWTVLPFPRACFQPL